MKTYTGKMNVYNLVMIIAFWVLGVGLSQRVAAQVTISGPESVCVDAGVNVYTAVGGTFPYSWTITSTGATPVTVIGNTPVITVDWGSLPGTGTINVVTGSGPASKTVLIGVATPAILGVFQVCTGSSYPYSVAYPVAGEDYDWVVAGGSPPVWSGTMGIVTWPTTPGAYTIALQASRPGEGSTVCYSDPVFQNVTVMAPPANGSAITGGTDQLCAGASTVLNAPAPPSGITYYNFVWTVTGSAPSVISFTGQGTSSITLLGGTVAGTASVTVSYSNVQDGSCTATSATRNITVIASPTPSISGSLLTCPGITTPYSVSGSTGSTFSWSLLPVSGSWYGTFTGGSTGSPVNVVWTNNTSVDQTATLTVTESAISGCSGLAGVIVTLKATPTANLVTDQIFCSGVIAPATPLTSPVTGTTFSWTNSNTAIGLAASGTGSSIPSFTAANSSAVPISAVISITPSANGCTGPVSTYNITIYPQFVAGTAALNQSICYNQVPLPLTATVPAGGLTPYSFQWEQSTDNLNFFPIAGATNMTYQPGSMGVSTWFRQAQTSSGSCGILYTNAVKITVNSLPVPTISGAATACVSTSGNVYTTEAGMNGYTWSVSGGTIDGAATGNAITVTWTSTGNQFIAVNYTNTNGCTASTPASKAVTVQSTVIPTIIGPDPSCTGYTAVYSTETGMSGYVWTVSSGGTLIGSANTNAVTIRWNSAGSQYVTVRYSDPGGCSATTPTQKNVQVFTAPSPTITGTTSICPSSSGVIYFTEQGMSDYVWTITSGGIITAGQGSHFISVDWISSGTQTITVNYKNGSGCNAASPTSKIITVYPTPQPVISGSSIACTGTTVYYSTETGMTNYVWSVSTGGTIVSGSGSNSISVIWNTSGAKTVSVSYLNTFGCPTLVPSVKNVTVNTTPLATITGSDTVCLDGTLVFSTESGMALYQWTVSGGIIISGQGTSSISVRWTQAGNGKVTVSYTTTNVCPSYADKIIRVLAPPVPVISGPSFACSGGQGSVFSTAPGMTGYNWSVSSGGTISTGLGTSTITVDWTATGLQYVRVSYTDQYGCTSSTPSQYNISVNERPANPVITGTTPSCVGSVDNTYSTQAGMGTYSWTVSSGGVILTNPSIHESTITVQWNTLGAQSVGVNYTSIAGCQALTPAVFPVTVTTRPVPTLSGPDSVCQNTAGNVYMTESGKSNYTWIVSPGGTITSGGTTSSNSVTVTWTGPGTKQVSVNYANESGCLAAAPAVVTVTVHPLPVPVISGPASPCQGIPGYSYVTEPGMTGYLWTVSTGGTIDSGQGTESISVTWVTAGTKTLSVIYTNQKGCQPTTPATRAVNVLAAPVPVIQGPAAACNGSQTVYQTSTGMSGYQWSITAGGTIISGSNTAEATIAWSAPGQQDVSVVYTTTNGCVPLIPSTKSVTVQNNVVAMITGPGQSCTGHSENYTTEAGMQNYIWSVSSGGTIVGVSNTRTVTITWNSAGTGSVSVIYTDPIGCTQANPTVKQVTVSGSPAPTITGTSPICQTSTGVVYFTEPGMSNYTWTLTSGGVLTAGQGTNAISVNWTGSGTQTITVNYTNPAGCNASVATSKTINVLPLPLPLITGPEIMCNGAISVYSTTSGMINYEWTLSSGGTIISGASTNSISVRWNTTGIHTISVTYINGSSGCPTQVPGSKQITVYPSPEPTITGADTVCIDGTVVFTTETGMALYQWSVGPGGIITSGSGTSSISVKWTQAGNRTVSVNYTNTNNCSAPVPATKTILVYPAPVPVITGLNYACVGGTGFEYSTDPGMTGYTWSVSSGGTITGGSGTHSITVSWNASGLQHVTVSYTDQHGCLSVVPTIFDVSVNERPVPTLTGTASACVGSTGNTYTTQTGMMQYEWTVSAGGTILTNPSDHASSIVVAWSSTGNQWVKVNYINLSGCNAVTPATFFCTVHPLPVPTVTGPSDVCLNSTGNMYRTEAGKTNYSWTISPGGIITAGGTATSDSVQITWTLSGIKTVKVNYVNSDLCTASQPSTLTVTVRELPVPVITGPATGCPATTGNIYTTEAGMSNYIWTISTGGVIAAGQGTSAISVNWLSSGTQSITVNYNDVNGCSASSTTVKTIVVNPLPVPLITGGSSGCVTFDASYSTETGMSNYLWSVTPGGTIISGVNSPTVTINWTATGLQTVYVSYTNSNGCTAVPSTKTVTVNELVIPTITGPDQGCTSIPVNYTTETGMAAYAWNVSTSGVITAGAGTHSITVIWYSAGSHTVGVNYVNQKGCTAATPTIKNVTITTAPVPWIDGPFQSCQQTTGVVYTTDPGMQNYLWTISAGGTITSGSGTATVTVTWSVPGNQWISVNYTDPAGCQAATATVKNVVVAAAPVPVITGLSQLCNGTTAVYYCEAGMSAYSWTITPGGIITSGAGTNAITVDWISAGTQSITVSYTDLNGCTALTPSQKTVTVHPLPVPTITNDPVACVNGITTFITEPGMNSYQWTVSTGGTIIAGAGTRSIVVSWTTAGTKTITVSYMDPNGCYPQQVTLKTISVSALPVPSIIGNGTTCLGSAGNVYSTEPGMSNYLWTVTSGGTITSGAGTQTITVTWNTLTPQVVSVNYTNPAGCTASAPTQFGATINPLPVPVLTGNATACAGSINNVYVTDPGMTNYIWNVSPGGTILTSTTTNTSSITVAWNTAGSQWVSVNYTNANGCTAAAPTLKSVVVQSSPNPVIVGISSACAGTTGVAYSTDPGFVNYLWSISPGGSITAGTGTNIITVTWITAGTQSVTVNYTNSNGCSAGQPTMKTVTVHALPVPTITGSSLSCLGGTTTHTTEAGMTGYQWTVSAGGTILSGSGSNSIQVQWTTAGPKTVTVNYTNVNGCTAATPSTRTVTVYSQPVPTISGATSLCSGATGVVYSTEGGMINYLWSVTAGGLITSGTGTNMITVNWTIAGVQGVSVNYTDAHGCNAAIPTNLPVTVNAVPVPTITGNTNPCMTSGNYSYLTEQGMLNYLWTVTSGGIIVGGQGTRNVQIYWTAPGAQTVTVTYTTPAGCNSLLSSLAVLVRSIPGTPGPVAGDTLICKPLTGVVYSVNPIPEATGYDWAVPAGATITSGANTNIITVNYGENAQSGNISVFGINTCGNGPYSPVLHVSVHPYPDAPVVTVIEPDTLVSSAPAGNQWYRDNQPIPGATAQQYVAYVPGQYFVIASPYGCASDPSNVIGVYPVGVGAQEVIRCQVYPNPADNNITLELAGTRCGASLDIWLTDNLGHKRQIVKQFELKEETKLGVELGNPPAGLYQLILQWDQTRIIKKLIILNQE